MTAGVTLDSHSFAAQIKGGKGQPREWIYVELNGKSYVRGARFKLTGGGELFDLGFENDVQGVDGGAQVVQLAGVGLFVYGGVFEVGLERLLDALGFVDEIEHEGVVFAGILAVEPGERLDGLDAVQAFIDVHGVE